MTEELTSLATLIQQRMDLLGIKSQADLARATKLTPQDINRFFGGGTKLPTAAKRRELARALGVSHLDLLIAAGEIDIEELGDVRGVVQPMPGDPKERLVELVRSMTFAADEIDAIADFIRWMADRQNRRRPRVEHSQSSSEHQG